MAKWAQRGAAGLFAAVMAAVLLCCVPLYDAGAIPHAAVSLLPQGAAWAVGCAIFAAMGAAVRRCAPARGQMRLLPGLAPWALAFCAQAVLFYFSYSMPDWDAQTVMLAAYQLAGGEGYIDAAYYAMYPNNILLTAIFSAVLRPFMLAAGSPGIERCALVLILLQCAVSCAAGWMMSRMARRMTGSRAAAACASAVYLLLMGVSPWLGVPYSNVMAMPIPLLALALAMGRSGRPALRWLGVGALTALGYLIKPQSAIMGIAALMMEAARLLGARRGGALAARAGAACLAFVLVTGPAFAAFSGWLGFEADAQRRVSALHYVALGLNPDTAGEYSAQDVSAAQALPAAQQRRALYVRMIRERLSGMGPAGLARHIARKTMINCGDGSLGWSVTDYWPHPIADKDGVLSPLLKDMYEQDGGARYPYLATAWQCVWLGLLTACAASVARLRRMAQGARWPALTMMLALVGLTLFGWLFETGAQMQMVYLPVTLLLAALALAGERGECA